MDNIDPILYKHIETIKDKNQKIFVAFAGAGTGINLALWYYPGASKFLIGTQFIYAKHEFDRFIGFQLNTSYVSKFAAIELAMTSYIRAAESCILDKFGIPLGIGITAATSTNRERKGANKFWIAKCDNTGIYCDEEVLESSNRTEQDDYISAVCIDYINGNSTLVDKSLQQFFTRSHYAHDVKDKGELLNWHNTIFMPGTYNPIHDGHRDIAEKTEKLTGKKVVYMTTQNPPHKTPLTVQDMLYKVAMIRLERFGYWGSRSIIFTYDDPLFIQKAEKFPNTSFVIGYDTAERMLDPKWGPNPISMFHDFKNLGTSFYVAGRLIDKQLKTCKDLNIPHMFKYMFIEVPNTGTDHSSTNIRNNNVI